MTVTSSVAGDLAPTTDPLTSETPEFFGLLLGWPEGGFVRGHYRWLERALRQPQLETEVPPVIEPTAVETRAERRARRFAEATAVRGPAQVQMGGRS